MKKSQLPLFVGLGSLIALFVSGVTAYLIPHIPLAWQISLGVAVVVAAAYLWIERVAVAALLSRRTTQYGLNSIFMSIVAIAIVVVINLIAKEHDIKRDLTKNKIHTLSEQSVKVLKGLQQEVKLRTFASPDQVPNFQKIFDKYTYHTKKVKPEFVDVDKEPLSVQKYGIKQAGTIVVESEARTVKVENIYGPDDPKVEEKITNAIIQVAKGEKKKVYFLSGHGEKLVSDSGKDGYSEIKEALENGRYKVEELMLLDKEKIPDDAEIVVVPAPKSDFMEHELKMLEGYVLGGGKLLVMVEPDSTSTLKPFFEKFGIDWKTGNTVLETNPLQRLAGGSPIAPIVVTYDTSSQITQEAKQPTIYPIPSPVEKMATAPQGYTVTSLFSTSPRSFEVPLKAIESSKDGRIQLDDKKNRKGPLSLAVTVTGKATKKAESAKPEGEKKEGEAAQAKAEDKPEKEPEFRLIVVGDSDFAANSTRRFGINADLFQNMMSWLSHEEDLIAIRPRSTDTSEFNITEERARVITFASVFFAPFGMWALGIAVWLIRRKS